MKKYRLYAVAALLLAPSILFSAPGSTAASLPEIDSGAKPFLQPNCPVQSGNGCFGGSLPTPATFCRQFMQMFKRPGAN
jgi:hypothetical protein